MVAAEIGMVARMTRRARDAVVCVGERAKQLGRNDMKLLKTGFIIGVVLGAVVATEALAAPNCNEAPYGRSCMVCKGWLNLSGWKNQACYLTSNPNGPRFACSSLKCGPIKIDGGKK